MSVVRPFSVLSKDETKAKSGNLNLFLRSLPFFHFFPCISQGKGGKIRRIMLRLPDFALIGAESKTGPFS